MSYPDIKISKSQARELDGVEIGVLQQVFAQQLGLKNATFPDIYITLLDATGMSPTLVLNQNSKSKEN